MDKQKSSPLSIFLIILSGMLWGTTGVFITYLREAGFDPLQIVFLRSALSTILLGIFLLIKDKSKFKFKLKDIWIFIGTGIISLMIFTICNQIAIKYCSMSIASALLYTSPAFIMIFSAFLFKEKLTGRKVSAIIVTILGCFLVSGILTPGVTVSTIGVIAGIISGLCYGLYSIFGRYGVEKYDTLTVTFYTFLLVTLATIPLANLTGIPAIVSSTKAGVIPLMICFGPITCLAPYLAYTAGLKGTEPGTAGILATVEPVVSTILSIIIFHEVMNWQKVLGIVMILGSVLIVNLRFRKKQKKI